MPFSLLQQHARGSESGQRCNSVPPAQESTLQRQDWLVTQQPCQCTGTVQCDLFPAPQVLPSVLLFLEGGGGYLEDVTLFGHQGTGGQCAVLRYLREHCKAHVEKA